MALNGIPDKIEAIIKAQLEILQNKGKMQPLEADDLAALCKLTETYATMMAIQKRRGIPPGRSKGTRLTDEQLEAYAK